MPVAIRKSKCRDRDLQDRNATRLLAYLWDLRAFGPSSSMSHAKLLRLLNYHKHKIETQSLVDSFAILMHDGLVVEHIEEATWVKTYYIPPEKLEVVEYQFLPASAYHRYRDEVLSLFKTGLIGFTLGLMHARAKSRKFISNVNVVDAVFRRLRDDGLLVEKISPTGQVFYYAGVDT